MQQDPFKVKEHNKEELLRLPNVVGVGVGPKVINDNPTSNLAIKVYVSRKLPKEKLSESDLVPERIEGIPTDVEQQAPMRAY